MLQKRQAVAVACAASRAAREAEGRPVLYVHDGKPQLLLPVPKQKMHRINITPTVLKPLLAKVRRFALQSLCFMGSYRFTI